MDHPQFTSKRHAVVPVCLCVCVCAHVWLLASMYVCVCFINKIMSKTILVIKLHAFQMITHPLFRSENYSNFFKYLKTKTFILSFSPKEIKFEKKGLKVTYVAQSLSMIIIDWYQM